MGLNSKRHLYSNTFLALTLTLYMTAVVLFFMTAPESEIITDKFELRLQREIVTRSQDNKHAGKVRQNIRAFESGYMIVKPRETDKEVYEGYNGQDMEPLEKKLFKKYSFNELESSKIGLERKIPDNRPEK